MIGFIVNHESARENFKDLAEDCLRFESIIQKSRLMPIGTNYVPIDKRMHKMSLIVICKLPIKGSDLGCGRRCSDKIIRV